MPEKILIVEDTASMREVLSDFLGLQGYECDTAADGLQGLALLDDNHYDLILTDLRLPEADGFAIIERANQKLPNSPKIIMTGYSDLSDAIRAVKLGAYDFLRKPLSKLDELGLVISRALQHGRLLSEREKHLAQIEEMNARLSQINETLEDEVGKRTEELRSANLQLRTLDEMKNNLLANISHELRTPLVSVRGYTELFFHGHLGVMPEGSQRYLQTCLNNIDKLLTLIDSLVRYAELVRNTEPLRLSEVCLNDLLEEECAKVETRAREAGCNLVCRILPEMAFVNADRDMLAQVVDNLLDNALKFNPAGTTVTVRLERAGRRLVKISIDDDGTGIEEKEQAKVFERFYQCDAGPTRKHGGTGIGLAIVRDNMRLMGSEVRLSSVPGKGSSFYWTMPALNNHCHDRPGDEA